MDEFSPNARRMLHLLERMRHHHRGPAIQQLADLNLSMSHMRILRLLAPERRLAMKELADELQLTPPSVTALTRRLVQTGLVARHRHTADSRVVLLALTDAGRRLHRQLYHEQLAGLERLLAGLSEEEQELFLELLERATQQLRAHGEPEPACGELSEEPPTTG